MRAQTQALDDIRAMQLAEAHVSRERVIAEAEKIVGKIEFSHCVNDTAALQNLRNRMIELILEA